MALGKKTGGRKTGVPNKLTTGAKEVIAQVAENIGGVARMTKIVVPRRRYRRREAAPKPAPGFRPSGVVHSCRRIQWIDRLRRARDRDTDNREARQQARRGH